MSKYSRRGVTSGVEYKLTRHNYLAKFMAGAVFKLKQGLRPLRGEQREVFALITKRGQPIEKGEKKLLLIYYDNN